MRRRRASCGHRRSARQHPRLSWAAMGRQFQVTAFECSRWMVNIELRWLSPCSTTGDRQVSGADLAGRPVRSTVSRWSRVTQQRRLAGEVMEFGRRISRSRCSTPVVRASQSFNASGQTDDGRPLQRRLNGVAIEVCSLPPPHRRRSDSEEDTCVVTVHDADPSASLHRTDAEVRLCRASCTS